MSIETSFTIDWILSKRLAGKGIALWLIRSEHNIPERLELFLSEDEDIQLSIHLAKNCGCPAWVRTRANRCKVGCSTAKLPGIEAPAGESSIPPYRRDACRSNLIAPSSKWRTGRDSNPRDSQKPTRFPSVRLQPLGHLSIIMPGRNCAGRAW